MKLRTYDWPSISRALASDVAFETHGSLRGERTTPGLVRPLGHLIHIADDAWGQELAASEREAAYVVYSYDTPIAWRDTTGRWTQPALKYSVTTTRHQNTVATAISALYTLG